MPNEAADDQADPNVASEGLVALVVKREQEMRAKDAPPAAKAADGTTKDESVVDKAEEGEAEEPKDEKAPEKGKADTKPKVPDVEWAPEKHKARLKSLYEAGHLDDDLLAEWKRAHLLGAGAYKKFEEAAEIRKTAKAEAEKYKERAERYERLMADPRYAKALEGAEKGEDEEEVDLLEMTPKQRREWIAAEVQRGIEEERRKGASSEEQRQERIREIESWAEDHKSSLNGTVSDEAYEAALKSTLEEWLESGMDPRAVLRHLTQEGLVKRVNKTLERQRLDQEYKSLLEQREESKRQVSRSAQASSPPGVRTQVPKHYATPQAKRIAETLEKYPVRQE